MKAQLNYSGSIERISHANFHCSPLPFVALLAAVVVAAVLIDFLQSLKKNKQKMEINLNTQREDN